MSVRIDNKVFINILLENGTDDEGNMKYVLCPLPAMNPDTFNKNKVLNMLQDIGPCLMKSIGAVHIVNGGNFQLL